MSITVVRFHISVPKGPVSEKAQRLADLEELSLACCLGIANYKEDNMGKLDDIKENLSASHVISYRLQNTEAWAGYSPANGKFWMMGVPFDTAKEAALAMSEYGLDRWEFVDQCIDED